MPIAINSLSIQGFRGINNNLDLKFNDGVTILLAPNGYGKSSIIQSIEWCLSGKLSYFSLDEFKKEDAIVNMYNSDNICKVQIILFNDGDKNIIVERTRKRGKSTTTGKSQLNIQLQKHNLEGEDAEAYIEQKIGIEKVAFSKVIYLHQESIRDVLAMKPDERSKGIDRLIGMTELEKLQIHLILRLQ